MHLYKLRRRQRNRLLSITEETHLVQQVGNLRKEMKKEREKGEEGKQTATKTKVK